MIRDEWHWSNDPVRLLHFLRGRSPGERKLRLFALACCLHADRFADAGSRAVLEMVGHYADGLIGADELWSAYMLLPAGAGRRLAIPRPIDTNDTGTVSNWCLGVAWGSPQETNPIGLAAEQRREAEFQCGLLRCIFGNPFDPVHFRPQWRCPDVEMLAAGLYSRPRPDGTLDAVTYAVLADALEEVGCNNAEMLGHLRGGRAHARGCWVLDLILQRR